MQIELRQREGTNGTLATGLLHQDPWGRNYALYRGEGGIAIVSAGPDGELGTANDVFYVPPQS